MSRITLTPCNNFKIKLTGVLNLKKNVIYYEKKKTFPSISYGCMNTTKITHILCQFCFIFFLGNTYKFCYEKKFIENYCQFFCKIFCIKHFSQ